MKRFYIVLAMQTPKTPVFKIKIYTDRIGGKIGGGKRERMGIGGMQAWLGEKLFILCLSMLFLFLNHGNDFPKPEKSF